MVNYIYINCKGELKSLIFYIENNYGSRKKTIFYNKYLFML